MILFNIAGPRAHLVCHGYVFTLRQIGTHLRKKTETAFREDKSGKLVPILSVKVEFIRGIKNYLDLFAYVKGSGLNDTRKTRSEVAKYWFELGKRLHRGRNLGLYKVTAIVPGKS